MSHLKDQKPFKSVPILRRFGTSLNWTGAFGVLTYTYALVKRFQLRGRNRVGLQRLRRIA